MAEAKRLHMQRRKNESCSIRWLGSSAEMSTRLIGRKCSLAGALDAEQIAKLPYKPWQGKEDTNPVWIDVAQPAKPAQKNQLRSELVNFFVQA